MELAGPYAGAGNDLDFLRMSQSLNSIRDVLDQVNAPDRQMDLIADKEYDIVADNIASIRRHAPNDLEEVIDTAGSKIRVLQEWTFEKTTSLFPFGDWSKKNKINERAIGQYMILAFLMTNCHTCLYGSQTNDWFSTPNNPVYPPTLEEYMGIN